MEKDYSYKDLDSIIYLYTKYRRHDNDYNIQKEYKINVKTDIKIQNSKGKWN